MFKALVNHPNRAFWFWFFTYLIVFVLSGIVMKILESSDVIPDDQPISKVFSINSTAFAYSMTFRWILAFPLWYVFGRNYLLQLSAQHVRHIKFEAYGLVIFWVILTILMDILVWVIIPYFIGNHPLSFVNESWPWLVLRYAAIYAAVMFSRNPAIAKLMRKRH
jgi:hypothetical protein